ncbi:MAG TPA: hypothetical protein VEI02_16025, partial [Planctomycetota bacterium]|nr:hypothetical protein [Planctomycetota bacterium]
QISGDLANAGRLAEAADLVAGVYRPDRHGPYPGVNLVRILGRLGRLDEAQKLLSDGRRLFGPPWKATFDQIEAELSRAPGAPA